MNAEKWNTQDGRKIAAVQTHIPTPEEGVTERQVERMRRLEHGVTTAREILDSPAVRAIIDARGKGHAVRVRLDHRKPNERQSHPTGLTFTIAKDCQSTELGTARTGPEGDYALAPDGGAYNLTCGECAAILSRRSDQLIQAHLEAITTGRRAAVLT